MRAALGSQSSSACSQYAKRVRAVFNYGPGKTACLPMFDSPYPDRDAIGCDVVGVSKVLGTLLDSQLTAEPMLGKVLARGCALFKEFFFAAESGGFPVDVIAAQTRIRIESTVLFVCEILMMCPRM